MVGKVACRPRSEESQIRILFTTTMSLPILILAFVSVVLCLVIALLLSILFYRTHSAIMLSSQPERWTSCELREKVQQLSTVSTSFYLDLYEHTWGSSVDEVFSSKDILRDPPTRRATVEDIPSVLTFTYKDSDYIVRSEYLDVYEDILTIFSIFSSAFTIPTRPSRSSVSMSEMHSLLSAIKAYDNNCVKRSALGVDINGQSGIGNSSFNLESMLLAYAFSGKSVFLGFVLIMRCLARLPTVFYDDKTTQFHIFTAQGVFYIDDDRFGIHFNTLLPQNTWCLIDGAPEREGDIPWQIKEANFFTLYASSGPHNAVMYDLKRARQPVLSYYMKTWTVAEIIAAYVFYSDSKTQCRNLIEGHRRPNTAASEQQLEQYMNLFSHNPRDAYKYAHCLQELEDLWNHRIGNLSAFQLDRVGQYQYDEGVHHFVYSIAFNIEPADIRGYPQTFISSDYVIETIRTRVHLLTAHQKLSQGGHWLVNRLLPNPIAGPAVNYKAENVGSAFLNTAPSSTTTSLILGEEGKNTFYLGPTKAGGLPFKPLPVDEIHSWAKPCLRESYSRATLSTCPSAACVYNIETKSVVVFDVTPSLAVHHASTELMDMLSMPGLERVDYVLITPSTDAESISVVFPKEAKATAPIRVWHLAMTKQHWISTMGKSPSTTVLLYFVHCVSDNLDQFNIKWMASRRIEGVPSLAVMRFQDVETSFSVIATSHCIQYN